jgi:ParB family chromosome partitioning protein
LSSKQQTGKKSERAALGKGLQALIGTRDLAPGERIERIPVKSIIPNPRQPRRNFGENELRDLTESLSQHGLLQPIIVTRNADDTFTLVAGERRLIASKAAGWSEIPALIRDYDELKSLQMALVENIQRENLNDIELAYAYRDLAETHGFTQAEISRMVGKSRPTVANTLRLLELPDIIQNGIIARRISAGHARALLGLSVESREKIFEKILKRGLSVRDVERIAVKIAREDENLEAQKAIDIDLETLARGLEDRLHRRVNIVKSRKGGRVIISFKDDEDLNNLLTRLSKI